MTCYAAYDDQAPTYYCTRPSGHDGWHAARDDDTGDLYQEWPPEKTFYHGRPVLIRGTGTSSQAGLASFSRFSAGPGSPVVRIPRPVRYCPDGHPITSRYEGQQDGDSIPIDECRTCGWKQDL